MSILVETFGTAKEDPAKIEAAVEPPSISALAPSCGTLILSVRSTRSLRRTVTSVATSFRGSSSAVSASSRLLSGPDRHHMIVRVARVLPNVTGLDKSFDYLIPEELAPRVQVGSIVRVELHGRRIGGWVTKMLDDGEAAVDADALKPIAKVTGHGPDASLLDLADWAAVRWAARRPRPFIVAASPQRAITSLPSQRRSTSELGATSPAAAEILQSGGGGAAAAAAERRVAGAALSNCMWSHPGSDADNCRCPLVCIATSSRGGLRCAHAR